MANPNFLVCVVGVVAVALGSVALAQDGALDTTFDPGAGVHVGGGGAVSVAALHGSGVVIGGNFTEVDGNGRLRVARLNSDGSLDTSFSALSGADWVVSALAIQPDNKILVGGDFTTLGNVSRSRVGRLNADGTLDTTFDPGSGADYAVNSLALQPDGKVIIAGAFGTINGVSRLGIARLNSDGSVDSTFNGATGLNGIVYSICLQPDGKVLVAGDFTTWSGVTRNRVVRLNSDGSLDSSFDPGAGPDWFVSQIVLQPDGKPVIGGAFSSVAGVSRTSIARLNSDGSHDSTFDPGTGATQGIGGEVKAVTLQPDGRLLIGGYFNEVDGTPRNRIARLNSNGDHDTGFNPGTGADFAINTVVLQPDGKIIVGGYFGEFNGVNRVGMARLNNPSLTSPPSFVNTPPTIGMEGQTYSHTIMAAGGVPIALSMQNAPAWLILSGSNLSGTPTETDVGVTSVITLTATNSFGSATQDFTIDVSASASSGGPSGNGDGGGGGGCMAGKRTGSWTLLLALGLFLGTLRRRYAARGQVRKPSG